MNRKDLIERLDSLCWDARRYGHDDNGIEGFAVDADGNEVSYDSDECFHPEAVTLADALLLAFGKS